MIAVFVLTAAVSGCAVGPDFHPIAAPAVRGYTPEPLPPRTASADVVGGTPQTLRPGENIPGQWWTLFHSAQLNRLIEQAMKANPSLQAAQAALREAEENVGAQEGYLYPSVVGGVSGLRERRLRYARGDPAGLGSPYTLMNVGVNVSYTLDVFGGIRRQVEADQAQSEYQRYLLEATYLALTANVVTAAVQEASLRGQIAATLELIKDEREQLVIVRNEFELGGASEADVLAQQTTLAQTQATLPPLEKQLEIERDLLRALTGHFPDQDLGEDFDLSTLELPQNLPLSLPSQLVEQRPDVREYEALVHQTSAGIGVATANMLPQFTISGGLGTFAGAGMNPGALAFSVLQGSPSQSSRAARCCIADVRLSRLTIRRLRSIVTRSWWRSRTSRTPCARSKRTPTTSRQRQPRSAPLRRVTALRASSIRRATSRIRHCWRRNMPISRHYSLWCRPRPAATRTQRRCFKRLGAAGGTDRMSSRRIARM